MFKIKENFPLYPYTNYKIGGQARYFCIVKNEKELAKAILFTQKEKLPLFILGGGSNILVSDKGFHGLVIKTNFSDVRIKENKIIAGSGVSLSHILKLTIEERLTGLEWAAGIPGTLGGAIRGNAGAFGSEIGDNIESIRLFDDKKLEVKELKNKNLGFGYRTSLVKEKGGVITEAVLSLEKETIDNLDIENKVKEYIDYRKKNQPLEYPSCGSVFKGVNGKKIKSIKTEGRIISAGILIKKTGLSGVKIGDAQISEKHANFIINLGKAKAKDVFSLIRLCRKRVKEKFNVDLELEVELVGDF